MFSIRTLIHTRLSTSILNLLEYQVAGKEFRIHLQEQKLPTHSQGLWYVLTWSPESVRLDRFLASKSYYSRVDCCCPWLWAWIPVRLILVFYTPHWDLAGGLAYTAYAWYFQLLFFKIILVLILTLPLAQQEMATTEPGSLHHCNDTRWNCTAVKNHCCLPPRSASWGNILSQLPPIPREGGN